MSDRTYGVGFGCTHCGECSYSCDARAIFSLNGSMFQIDSTRCNGCGICAEVCPAQAIVTYDGF